MKIIRFECTNCAMPLEADARGAGHAVESPQCGELLTIPRTAAAAAAPGPEKNQPASPHPPDIPRERLTATTKFCITCSRDVPDNNLKCPHCGGGRFGRL